MDVNEYQKMALRTLNKKLNKDEVLLNGAMGLCGESGEVIDILKKHLMHGHDIDREHLIKELGDVSWYLAIAAYAIDCDLSEVFEKNIAKQLAAMRRNRQDRHRKEQECYPTLCPYED